MMKHINDKPIDIITESAELLDSIDKDKELIDITKAKTLTRDEVSDLLNDNMIGVYDIEEEDD